MLQINTLCLDPQAIILDKDGTLIAFDPLWHGWFERFMGAIEQQKPLGQSTREGLAGTLGYDLTTGAWDPLGPLTVAATSEILLLTAGQLYHHEHLTWDEALEIVNRAEQLARQALTDARLVQPLGDVRGTLERLVKAGYRLALATTDLRAPTLAHLEILGVKDLLSAILCGDDGIPLKPAPDMALALCEELGVLPQEAIMVGDSVADMVMARKAGLAAAIGISAGAVPADLLRPYADTLIPTLEAIRIKREEANA